MEHVEQLPIPRGPFVVLDVVDLGEYGAGPTKRRLRASQDIRLETLDVDLEEAYLSRRILHQVVERFAPDGDPLHNLGIRWAIGFRQVADRLEHARENGIARAKDLAPSRRVIEDDLEHLPVRVLACPAAQCRLAVREGFDGYDLLRSHQKMNCPEEVAL